MVLLIAAIGRMILGQWDWFVRPGIRGYLIMIMTGFVLAVSVEWVALHVFNRWQYTEHMPKLPVLNIGLIPLLQMMVLPPLIFRVAASRERKHLRRKTGPGSSQKEIIE